MAEQQFRIPKISVPVICHTLQGEKIAGDIFVDVISLQGYTTQQLLDYLNAQPPFFPIRTSTAQRPLLILKDSLVQVDVPHLMKQYQEETSTTLAQKKEAILYMQTLGPVRGIVILDLPEEYARILDLLNLKRTFFPAIIHEQFVILNSHHIYKIEEL